MTSVEVLPERWSSRAATVGLWGIGTAVPGSIAQLDAIPLAEALACRSDKERSFLQRVFARSGVESRGSVLVKEGGGIAEQLRAFYRPRADDSDRGPTTAERMIVYAREAPVLAEQAARSAVENAGILPHDITHIITVSCTGFVAPGLDVEMIQRIHLRPDVRRTHIGFMGCHAAFNALGAARAIVAADPAAVVLVVCVELSSLHFAYGFDPQKLVANALFADGAAATIVGEAREDAPEWRLRITASQFLPDTLDAMTWRIGNHGFEMTLLPELPTIIRANVRTWCDAWLSRAGTSLGDIKSWAVHPGGPKILDAVAEALALAPDALRFSRSVLAHHGNMSSATVLFILQEMARDNAPSPCLALGFGPGLMLEGMFLER
ncbi:MAG TPA: type III polyketide synthase [Phycisphaerae bacterium]|nr:type III polyketide synthase [Phycisphaerae bacterium]